MNAQNGSTAHATRRDIVVVGASAGGVEALSEFVAGLPHSFPAAILVVLHIPTHSPSSLHEILNRAGALPVTAAIDGEPLRRGHVYCAPANHHLMVAGDHLRLTHGPKESRMRPSVDVLFRSAAYCCGPRVIGVVLTGMLDDGTAGLWAIKDRGGLAVVQSPAEAVYPSMPQSALAHVDVDAAVSLVEMPTLLHQWVNEEIEVKADVPKSAAMEREYQIALGNNALQEGALILGPPSVFTCPECHGVLFQIQEGSITRYRCHTGHAYSQDSLLAETYEQMSDTLWNAIRTFEEHVLLLREMAQAARDVRKEHLAEQIVQRVEHTEQQLTKLRAIVMQPNHAPAPNGARGETV